MWPVAIGAAAGLPASYLAARLVRGFLYGVQPGDAVAFSSALLLLAIVIIAATCAPAYRALRLQPADALRRD